MKKLAVCMVMALLPWGHVLAAETLPEVVATAERMGVNRKEEPQAVEVITAKDFERQGAGNVSEALAGALSLDLSAGAQNATSAMGGHQAQIRGMNTNHTLILVDGRRLADEDTSQTQNMYLLDRINLSTVDRIEILRGPAGAMYGSDAMGGVIQIITKKPGRREAEAGYRLSSRENEAHFRLDPGSLGRFSFAVSGRISKLRPISFRHQGAGEHGMAYDGWDTPTYGIQKYISLDTLYDFQNANRNTLRYTLDYFHEDTDFRFSDASYSMRGMTLPVQQGETSSTERTGWNTALTYEGDTGRNAYHAGAYYSRMKKSSATTNGREAFPPFFSHIPIGPGVSLGGMLDTLFPVYDTDHALYERWGWEARDTAVMGNHRLTFGGEYEKNTYTGTRLVLNTPGADKGEAGHEQHHGAVYVADFWQVGSRLTLTPSFRMERGKTYGFVGTPRIGATYALDAHTRLKANYGKGFHAPTVSELYLRLNHMSYQITGNPDLSPEKSQSYDLSLEWERGRTAGKVSYFQNKVKNLIDTENQGGGRYTYVNRKRADIQGVEAELSHALGQAWTARAGYTYLDAQDKSAGSRLENRARHQMTVSLDYDDGAPYGWSGKLWDSLEDSYYFDSQSYTYHLLNLSVQKHWGKALTLSAGLYNIGNKKIDDLYVDGREWFCGMEMKM